jgi:DNA-binding transcriptional regulator YhcF (GntR family)
MSSKYRRKEVAIMQEAIRKYLEQARAVTRKKKAPSPVVPSEEEIREMESLKISKKVKEAVCKEVAKKMGISAKEVRGLMERLESDMVTKKLKK